jgi:hypothetical protein
VIFSSPSITFGAGFPGAEDIGGIGGLFSLPKTAMGDPYGRRIEEFTGGDRFVEVATSGYKTVSRGPLPANLVLGKRGSRSAVGTPLSEAWSEWPRDTISNKSIFSYLVDSGGTNAFSRFVRDWYKSSCAIVYYSESGEPKLIGTGGYVDGSSWVGVDRGEGVVTTARHNFEGLSVQYLYVRFFDYSVETVEGYPGWLRVRESFIDVPVVGKQIAEGGLDAGILRLLSISRGHRRQYTQMITPSIEGYEDDRRTIPAGQYAMFHFAGTRHLVSVGHVYSPPMGSWLSSDVRIEAGPGASGAVLLQQIGRSVSSEGISVYRHTDNFGIGVSIQRRIIPYARFTRPGVLDDGITAPYRRNPSFRVIPPLSLEEDGYEFLRWRTERHVSRRTGMDARGRTVSLFGHPRHDAYALDDPDTMSNHHIIPIDHLLYLWEYVFDDRLDEDTLSRIGSETAFLFPRASRATFNREYQRRVREEIDTRYGVMKRLLQSLSPEGREDKTWFAWSWWNLFKGPKGTYREDDPAKDGSYDFSEKVKPLEFDKRLWSIIKDLDVAIKALIQASKSTFGKERDVLVAEGRVQRILAALSEAWAGVREQRVHPYKKGEWALTGRSAGRATTKHPLYVLRKG